MNALFTDLKRVFEEKGGGLIISDLGCEGVFLLGLITINFHVVSQFYLFVIM